SGMATRPWAALALHDALPISTRRSSRDLAVGRGQDLLDLGDQAGQGVRVGGAVGGGFELPEAGGPPGEALHRDELPPVLEEGVQGGDGALRGGLLGGPVEMLPELRKPGRGDLRDG